MTCWAKARSNSAGNERPCAAWPPDDAALAGIDGYCYLYNTGGDIMPVAAFDTLGYFEKLKAAGVPETQARAF
jgi:hypothetical protein